MASTEGLDDAGTTTGELCAESDAQRDVDSVHGSPVRDTTAPAMQQFSSPGGAGDGAPEDVGLEDATGAVELAGATDGAS